MKTDDLVGHVGYVLIGVGLLLIATQHGTLGWASRVVGDVVWVALGTRMKMTSIALWGSVFVALDTYGLIVSF